MKPILLLLFLSWSLLVAAQQLKQRKPGNPLDHLPGNIQVLTRFGERADFSPDSKSIAFMAKSFGDAMVMDLATREIRCLTCNSADGRYMAFQLANTADPAGVGYGLLLYKFLRKKSPE